MTPRDRRNLAVRYAKMYARYGRPAVARAWAERAARIMPLSELQIFNLQQVMGEEAVRDLNLGERVKKTHD